jgi:hypothetical protein
MCKYVVRCIVYVYVCCSVSVSMSVCMCAHVRVQERGINLPSLPEAQWDQPLGAGSGAGVLFGTTGGVMEAALRTVSGK